MVLRKVGHDGGVRGKCGKFRIRAPQHSRGTRALLSRYYYYFITLLVERIKLRAARFPTTMSVYTIAEGILENDWSAFGKCYASPTGRAMHHTNFNLNTVSYSERADLKWRRDAVVRFCN